MHRWSDLELIGIFHITDALTYVEIHAMFLRNGLIFHFFCQISLSLSARVRVHVCVSLGTGVQLGVRENGFLKLWLVLAE